MQQLSDVETVWENKIGLKERKTSTPVGCYGWKQKSRASIGCL